MGQNTAVLNVNQDIGVLSRATFDYVSDIQKGLMSNQVAKLEGVYGWQSGPTRYSLQATHAPSWEGGQVRGASDYFQFRNRVPAGKLQYSVSYQDIGRTSSATWASSRNWTCGVRR